MSNPPVSPPLLSIAEVERDTGLGKDTLRVWERRYGFPVPARDGQGQRFYTQAEVDRLRQIATLLRAGHRPGRVVGLDDAARLALLQPAAPPASSAVGAGGPAEAEPAPMQLAAIEAALALLARRDGLGLRRGWRHQDRPARSNPRVRQRSATGLRCEGYREPWV